MQRRPMLSLLAGMAGALAALPAQAQPAWPTQPVKIVVPTGPGSSLDLIVRLLGDKLAARWGQPVVVDNKPGAGGMLGLDIVAKATDGHTLGIGFNGPHRSRRAVCEDAGLFSTPPQPGRPCGSRVF